MLSQKGSITKGITEIALGDTILRNVFLFDEILVDVSTWQLRVSYHWGNTQNCQNSSKDQLPLIVLPLSLNVIAEYAAYLRSCHSHN